MIEFLKLIGVGLLAVILVVITLGILGFFLSYIPPEFFAVAALITAIIAFLWGIGTVADVVMGSCFNFDIMDWIDDQIERIKK